MSKEPRQIRPHIPGDVTTSRRHPGKPFSLRTVIKCEYCGGDGAPHPECMIADASLQPNEGSCDVCDMRWTGYGTQCPVCEGER